MSHRAVVEENGNLGKGMKKLLSPPPMLDLWLV